MLFPSFSQPFATDDDPIRYRALEADMAVVRQDESIAATGAGCAAQGGLRRRRCDAVESLAVASVRRFGRVGRHFPGACIRCHALDAIADARNRLSRTMRRARRAGARSETQEWRGFVSGDSPMGHSKIATRYRQSLGRFA